MTSVQAITLGCSKNTVDTQHVLAQLPSDRFKILPEDWQGKADVVLVNTCGFIGDAKEESIQAVLGVAQRKAEGLVGRIIVFGCLSQRYMADLPGLIPEVDEWYGARDLAPVVKALGGGSYDPTARWMGDDPRPYAFLKISEGCDRRCSYCAIPLIRGAHKSVPIETLVKEARELASKGVKELILIAQDTTFYGLDLYGRRALAELLEKLSEVEGIEWMRIHYSYPSDFPDDVLDQMAHNPKVCRYLDIPLQHIADPVLSAMHRHIDSATTRRLIGRLRQEVPGVVLRTTMMVGHPGEGEAEFDELLDFVQEARFERLGAFKYSEEEGTWGASNLPDSVSPEDKQSRLDALMETQAGISSSFNLSRVGTEEKVLVDCVFDGNLICRSEFESPEVDGEIIVSLPEGKSPEEFVGKFIKVRVTAAEEYDLRAEII